MIVSRHMRPEDLDRLPLRAPERKILENDEARAILKRSIAANPSIILVTGALLDQPLIAAGMVAGNYGVGDVWTLTCEGIERHVLGVIKRLRQHIRVTRGNFGLRIVHTCIFEGNERAARFARLVGFDYEATLQGIGPGGETMEIFTWHGG